MHMTMSGESEAAHRAKDYSTRLLGDLHTRGLISIVGTGRDERFCLHT
jgi:hypothetical protein